MCKQFFHQNLYQLISLHPMFVKYPAYYNLFHKSCATLSKPSKIVLLFALCTSATTKKCAACGERETINVLPLALKDQCISYHAGLQDAFGCWEEPSIRNTRIRILRLSFFGATHTPFFPFMHHLRSLHSVARNV